jgi:PAS domain S-box-containing protein
MSKKNFQSGVSKKSIAFTYVGLTSTFVLVSQLLFGAFQINRSYQQKATDLHQRAYQTAQLLRTAGQESLFHSNDLTLDVLLQQLTQNQEIVYGVVLDEQQRLVANALNQNNSIMAQVIYNSRPDSHVFYWVKKARQNPKLREIQVPIISNQLVRGEVWLGYSVEGVETQLQMSVFLTMIEAILVSLGVGTLTFCLFHRQISQPLQELGDLAQALADGEFHRRAVGYFDGEIGQLKTAFNQMASQLQQTVLNLEQRVDEHQRTQDALQQSYLLLQTVIEGTTDAIYVKNFQGRYVLINSAGASMLGKPKEAIIGCDDRELLSPETAQQIMKSDRKILIRGETQTVEEVVTTALENIPDGSQSTKTLMKTFLTKKDVYCDSLGNVIGLICVARDITERKQAEEALHLSEAQFREQALQLEQAIHELKRTQAQLVQSEKMSSLGQLVAGVAHEINNPINFIYGNLDHTEIYIQDLLNLVSLYEKHYPNPHLEIQAEIEKIDLDFLSDDIPKVLSSIRTGAERVSQIVLSLRNFSRLDESAAKAVNLHEGIDNTLTILNHRITPDIKIIKNYGKLPLIECYPAALNQVFMNIISNAIDALEAKEADKTLMIQTEVLSDLDVQVLAGSQRRSQENVLIRIIDNGAGILPHLKHKIFDPFFTTKPVGKGTGLGLSICHQIINQHGGHIFVDSQPGESTEFVISLPIKSNNISSVV